MTIEDSRKKETSSQSTNHFLRKITQFLFFKTL